MADSPWARERSAPSRELRATSDHAPVAVATRVLMAANLHVEGQHALGRNAHRALRVDRLFAPSLRDIQLTAIRGLPARDDERDRIATVTLDAGQREHRVRRQAQLVADLKSPGGAREEPEGEVDVLGVDGLGHRGEEVVVARRQRLGPFDLRRAPAGPR